LAHQNWAAGAPENACKNTISPSLVTKIYKEELHSCGPGPGRRAAANANRRLQLLEVTSYLENYLWPHFHATKSSLPHVMSIVLMANEKFARGFSFWDAVGVEGAGGGKGGEKFTAFFARIQDLLTGAWTRFDKKQAAAAAAASAGAAPKLSYHERAALTLFLINVFQSLEQPLVRGAALRLCSLPLWAALSPGRLALELKAYPQLRRHWLHLQEQAAAAARAAAAANGNAPAADGGGGAAAAPEGGSRKRKKPPTDEADAAADGEANAGDKGKGKGRLPEGLMAYLERFLELLVDLLSQLPTRRFLRAVLLDMKVLERCTLCPLGDGAEGVPRPEGKLFRQLLEMYRFYLGFEINDQTGRPLSGEEVVAMHQTRLHTLQRIVFKHYKEVLPELPFASASQAGRRAYLE
ncbi:hypothetical protein JKP88DRAFT_137081, partial [Tribonema minus]